MKYAHYNETDGKLIGWYDDEIHGTLIEEVLNADGTVKTPSYYDISTIPIPNIEVSEADWHVAVDNNYNYVDTTTNKLSLKDFRTAAEILAQQAQAINTAIQSHLDSKAQQFRYDNMMSARSYAGYANPFQAEAQKLAIWASDCWVVAGTIEADVQAGVRPMPTVAKVIAELPVYV